MSIVQRYKSLFNFYYLSYRWYVNDTVYSHWNKFNIYNLMLIVLLSNLIRPKRWNDYDIYDWIWFIFYLSFLYVTIIKWVIDDTFNEACDRYIESVKDIDPDDIENWNDSNSKLWHIKYTEKLRNYDYFHQIICDGLNMPTLYDFKFRFRRNYNHFLNPRSQYIFQVVMNTYNLLLSNARNGMNFTSCILNEQERNVLGIDAVNAHPIDNLILRSNLANNLIIHWIKYPSMTLIALDKNRINLANRGNCIDEIFIAMHHLAWIKARFDMLNNDISQSLRMQEWVRFKFVIFTYTIIKLHWEAFNDNNSIHYHDADLFEFMSESGIICCKLLHYEPNKILDEFYRDHPEHVIHRESMLSYYSSKAIELYDKTCSLVGTGYSLGRGYLGWDSSFQDEAILGHEESTTDISLTG